MSDVAEEENLDIEDIRISFEQENTKKRSLGNALAIVQTKFEKILTKPESEDLLTTKTLIKNQLRLGLQILLKIFQVLHFSSFVQKRFEFFFLIFET